MADPMPTTSSVPHISRLHRSRSWPSPSDVSQRSQSLPSLNVPILSTQFSHSIPPRKSAKVPDLGEFDRDLDRNPDAHFLSPMDAHDEYWLEWSDEEDDSEADDEEFQWDAGITDFTLFNNERRAAVESRGHISSQWDDLVSSQKSALKRADQRANTSHSPFAIARPRSFSDEDVPGLTPDHSPNLRQGMMEPRTRSHVGVGAANTWHTPAHNNYLQPSISYITGHQQRQRRHSSSSAPDEYNSHDDDDHSLCFVTPHRQSYPPARPKLQRPGIQGARTMSGRVHAWRPPSWYIATVDEDPDAEAKADAESIYE